MAHIEEHPVRIWDRSSIVGYNFETCFRDSSAELWDPASIMLLAMGNEVRDLAHLLRLCAWSWLLHKLDQFLSGSFLSEG